jgi:ring-1,2-phenylacetyl-CoA epoxidase subunit PaaE
MRWYKWCFPVWAWKNGVNYVSDYLIEAGLPKGLIYFELSVPGQKINERRPLNKMLRNMIVDGGKRIFIHHDYEYDNIPLLF